MQESELNPDSQEKKQTSAINSDDKLNDYEKEEEKLVSLNNSSNNEQKDKKDTSKDLKNGDSLFKRILENGFDGVTTNPNYKLLALLIILLINLSLFFLVGNLGKNFLKSSGILG